MNEVYHIPAMLQETIEGLNIRPDGIYVDVTFGGGGHSRAIMKGLNDGGKLFSFDQDIEAFENAVESGEWKVESGRLFIVISDTYATGWTTTASKQSTVC